MRRETRRVITYRENNNNPTSSERNHVHLTCGKPAAVWRLLTPCNAVHPPILDVWKTCVKPDVWETCSLMVAYTTQRGIPSHTERVGNLQQFGDCSRHATRYTHPYVWKTCGKPDVWETCSLMVAHTMQRGTPTHTGRAGNLCKT